MLWDGGWPSIKCQLKRELRAATSLFTARWASANRGQPPGVSSSVS